MKQDAIGQAAELLRRARSACALTGAGVSKESGVPTFRDAQAGLWAQYDPQELATPDAFRRHPARVWDWYTYRREIIAGVEPNPGHTALAALERHITPFTVITQNVDDLHERAGSRDVIHLHGNIAGNKCFYDCQGSPTYVDIDALDVDPDDGPPMCPHCGRQSVRPDVVWFGEMLPEHALTRAMQIAQQADVMLVVGTSGLVTPAALLPNYARQAGKPLIEVNPDTSAITRIVDVRLDGPSGEMLPRLIEALHG
jgi:NAD-dependent deacetylase